MHSARISFGLLALAFIGACGGDDVDPGAFEVFPLKAYTGFDEGMSYVVPIGAEGTTGVVWSSSNEAVATVTGNDTLATVTGKTAGTAKITATANGETMTVDLTVVMYTSAERTAGQTVYTDFDCGDCHGPTSESDITSSGIAEHTDAEILAAIVMGLEPEGGPVESENHMYALTMDQQRQMLAYLRATAPQGAPKPD